MCLLLFTLFNAFFIPILNLTQYICIKSSVITIEENVSYRRGSISISISIVRWGDGGKNGTMGARNLLEKCRSSRMQTFSHLKVGQNKNKLRETAEMQGIHLQQMQLHMFENKSAFRLNLHILSIYSGYYHYYHYHRTSF